MRVTLRQSYNTLVTLLFLQMVLLPKTYMMIKMFFMLYIILISYIINRWRIRIDTGNILILLYVSWNVVCICKGIMKGYTTDAIRVGTIDILWPLVYVILSSITIYKKDYQKLLKLFVLIVYLMGLMDLLLIVSSFLHIGQVSEWFSYFMINKPVGGIGDGYFFFRIDHVYFYSFFAPFMLSLYYEKSNSKTNIIVVSKRSITGAMIISILMAVMSGLGAIWIACATGLVIVIFKYRLLYSGGTQRIAKRYILIIIGIIFVIIGLLTKGFSYSVFQEVLLRIGKVDRVVSYESPRIAQMAVMIKEWMKSPFTGQGRGVPVQYIRMGSNFEGAQNEISYLIILYQKGIIGFLSFFSIVFYAIHILHKRRDIYWITNPFLTGMICYLVSNIFNPYLTNFSNYWILFMPYIFSIYNTTCSEK